MDCKIVDFLIVNLWIVLDGVLIATAQLLSRINPPRMEKRYMFVFCFLTPQALLLSPPPPPFLSVFVCLSKAYSYSLPTVLCNKKPFRGCQPVALMKNGPLCNCLIYDQLPHFCFCNFLLNDVK